MVVDVSICLVGVFWGEKGGGGINYAFTVRMCLDVFETFLSSLVQLWLQPL